MRSRYLKYIVSSVMILSGVQGGGFMRNAFAREAEQTGEISGSDRDYLQWQLKQMEESFQKQQEQIQALKNRVESLSAEPAPVASKEEMIHTFEDYLSTDEARKKLGIGMPSGTAMFTPDEEKYSLVFSPMMRNIHWVLVAGCNSGIRLRIMTRILGKRTEMTWTSAGQGFAWGETYTVK